MVSGWILIFISIICIKRGVSAYQGDIKSFLSQFEDNAFDRVILSRRRSVRRADWIINKSLQVGVRVTVGLVNNGYWENRCNAFLGSQDCQ